MKNIFAHGHSLFMAALSVIFFSVGALQLSAQSVKVDGRFGKVSDAEVMMEAYPLDTSAVAVVLCENGSIRMSVRSDGALVSTLSYNVRYKILKEDGVRYADFEIPYYWLPELKETVSGINVVSYNNVGGKTVESKMPRNLIFQEIVSDNLRLCKFTAPDVRVGTVIDVQYRVSSDMYWIIDDFYLQKDIPVNEVEYSVMLPDMFQFSKHVRGYVPVGFSESSGSGRFMFMGTSLPFTEITHRYSATDVPAMKKEPYMYNTSQYMSAVSYDLSSFQMPGYLAKTFSTRWQDVDDDLLESSVGKCVRAACPLKDEVNAAKASSASEEDLIMNICSLVKGKVSWNGDVRLYPDLPGNVLHSASSSNAGINAVIASALNYAGFLVEPVVLKRRSSGLLLEYRPETSAFDTFILRVVTPSGKIHYLDGMSYNGYLDILPVDFLVANARILRKDGMSEWTDITGLCRNSRTYVVNADASEGLVKGKMQIRFTGEDSYAFKTEYKGYDSRDEYISAFESENSVSIDGFDMTGTGGMSSYCSVMFDFEQKGTVAGDMMYVNPFIVRFHSASSFSAPERKYPVDFPYRTTISYVYRLKVPEGYVLEQLPESMAMTLDAIGSSVRLVCSGQGAGYVSLRYDFILGRMRGDAADYEYIREYWGYLSRIYDNVIVFRKIQ